MSKNMLTLHQFLKKDDPFDERNFPNFQIFFRKSFYKEVFIVQ